MAEVQVVALVRLGGTRGSAQFCRCTKMWAMVNSQSEFFCVRSNVLFGRWQKFVAPMGCLHAIAFAWNFCHCVVLKGRGDHLSCAVALGLVIVNKFFYFLLWWV